MKGKAWRAAAVAVTVALTTGAAAGEAVRADAVASETGVAPEQVLREELRGVLSRLAASGAFDGEASGRVALSLALPAERVIDFGAVLDRRDGGEGLLVQGVSPGGLAATIGVARGDRLLAVNGSALGRGDAALAALRAALDGSADGERIGLSLERRGRRIELDGRVTARYLPPVRIELGEGSLLASTAPARAAVAGATLASADGGCGRISVFHVAPRSQQLYPARVLEIDGRIPGPANQDTYRVPAGRHELSVAEQILERDLPASFSRQRMRSAVSTKSLVVEVEPDRTLLIAARLLDTAAADPKRYWEPVVWKTIDEPCR